MKPVSCDTHLGGVQQRGALQLQRADQCSSCNETI